MKSAVLFDIEQRQWLKLPDLIDKRANAGIFAIQNEVIYAFGGFYTES